MANFIFPTLKQILMLSEKKSMLNEFLVTFFNSLEKFMKVGSSQEKIHQINRPKCKESDKKNVARGVCFSRDDLTFMKSSRLLKNITRNSSNIEILFRKH